MIVASRAGTLAIANHLGLGRFRNPCTVNNTNAAKQTRTTRLYIGAYGTYIVQGSRLMEPPGACGRDLGAFGGKNFDKIGNTAVAVAAIPLVTRYGTFI